MQADLAAARRWASAHLRPALAGIYAMDTPQFQIANIVGGIHVGTELKRSKLRSFIPLTNKHFNGSSVGLSFRHGSRDTDVYTATATAFDTGSVQFVGALNVPVFKLMIHKFNEQLRANGLHTRMLFVSIDNVVATSRMGFNVALHKLTYIPGFSIVYVPDDFPGLVCSSTRLHNPTVTLLFESGRATVLGITSVSSAIEQFMELRVVGRLNQMPESVKLQKAKSRQRSARLADETDAWKHDDTTSKSNRGAKICSVAIAARDRFRDMFPHLLDTQEGERQMDAYIQNAVAEAQSKAAAKRPRGKRATQLLYDDDDDDDDDGEILAQGRVRFVDDD